MFYSDFSNFNFKNKDEIRNMSSNEFEIALRDLDSFYDGVVENLIEKEKNRVEKFEKDFAENQERAKLEYEKEQQAKLDDMVKAFKLKIKEDKRLEQINDMSYSLKSEIFQLRNFLAKSDIVNQGNFSELKSLERALSDLENLY